MSELDPGAVFAAVAGQTHPGLRRLENQDNFIITDLAEAGNLVLRPQAADGAAVGATVTLNASGVLLLVADGMGGAAGGKLASGLACSFILAALHESWTAETVRTERRFAQRLRAAVEKANRRIHEHARRNPECAGMGTTATVAGVLRGTVYVAQVGDSRAYLVRGGRATQLTRDQSLVQQMIDAGALTPEEAERSAHGNLILQALGVEPAVAVELTSQELRRGDVIVLCSDGLHRVVRAEEIANAVARLAEPEAVCAELVALANDRGGPDNVTIVIARVDGAGLDAPQPSDDVSHRPLALADDD